MMVKVPTAEPPVRPSRELSREQASGEVSEQCCRSLGPDS
jgi:hypothetical protein